MTHIGELIGGPMDGTRLYVAGVNGVRELCVAGRVGRFTVGSPESPLVLPTFHVYER